MGHVCARRATRFRPAASKAFATRPRPSAERRTGGGRNERTDCLPAAAPAAPVQTGLTGAGQQPGAKCSRPATSPSASRSRRRSARTSKPSSARSRRSRAMATPTTSPTTSRPWCTSPAWRSASCSSRPGWSRWCSSPAATAIAWASRATCSARRCSASTPSCAFSGDHPIWGDHPQCKAVYDMDSLNLIRMARMMRNNQVFENGKPIPKLAPDFFIGAVENPFAPPYDYRPYPPGEEDRRRRAVHPDAAHLQRGPLPRVHEARGRPGPAREDRHPGGRRPGALDQGGRVHEERGRRHGCARLGAEAAGGAVEGRSGRRPASTSAARSPTRCGRSRACGPAHHGRVSWPAAVPQVAKNAGAVSAAGAGGRPGSGSSRDCRIGIYGNASSDRHWRSAGHFFGVRQFGLMRARPMSLR